MSRQFTIISSQTRNRLKWELQSLPLQSLISVTEQIMSHFSPVNMYNHNISSFCQSYSDTDGRIQFILSALDQGVVTPNQLPHALKKASGITDSDRKIVPAGFTLQKREDGEGGELEVVLTDELEMTPAQQVQISNPRWEPIAAEEDSDSEASTDSEDPFIDETIKLLADVKNYPDGASVSFDIYDVTEGTPMRIATVTGTNSGGTASAEWKVEDPQERGDALKLQFEAGARSKYTEKTDLPVQEKLTCDFVEMPDVLFHHNSAVPCLDQEAILLGALTATILFAKENTGKEIVIFGHTDTSGDPAYNFDLSAWRAEGIKALLGGDKDSWLDVVDLASKVEDYQTILATLYTTYGWECDPGAVDNTNGPKTKAAIKSFQEEFNSRYQGALKADGMIGPKTWGALFDTVCSLLKEVLQEETGDTVLPTLTYGYSGSGLYPCGESFPVDSADKDGYKSATNRRVEIVFYDAGKAPKLIKPADKKKVTKKEAPVYDKKKTEKKPVEVKPAISVDKQPSFISAGFSTKKLRCGDIVELNAVSKNFVENQEVVFDLIQADTKAVYGSIKGKIVSQASKIEWQSQMALRNKNAPKTGLMVNALSKKLLSTEELTFLEYANIAKATKVINCLSGAFKWTGKFDISFLDGEITVLVKIKLVNRLGPKPAAGSPLPKIGKAVSDQQKSVMKHDIESKLDGWWKIHRNGCKRGNSCSCSDFNRCCKFLMRTIVEFVESGEHHTVNLFQGSGRANATNWTLTKTRDNSWAHETGHLLGWYDEYTGGAVGNSPRWKSENTIGIMNVGLTVPKEYYWDFRDWFDTSTGERWDLI